MGCCFSKATSKDIAGAPSKDTLASTDDQFLLVNGQSNSLPDGQKINLVGSGVHPISNIRDTSDGTPIKYTKEPLSGHQITLNLMQQIPHNDHRPIGKIVIALYSYTARDVGDLSFVKGDRLLVIDDSDRDWWHAKHLKSQVDGYVPSNYVAAEKTVESEE
ncbi:Tyrosine-protein kinase Src64B [Nymphon striatum]|nr:Tyrosine-protein kinase Src64B [Nymphon striatum]